VAANRLAVYPSIYAGMNSMLFFVPNRMADTLEGQVQWWVCGFMLAVVCFLFGQLVRWIMELKRPGGGE
jgi:hypothetical protein